MEKPIYDSVAIMPYKVGSRVQKGSKIGSIIQLSPTDAIVMWANGVITHEDPYNLVEVKNPALEYMRKVKCL